MQIAEFDRFADEYEELHRANIAITGEAPEYFAEYKIRVLSEMVRDFHATRILDFGSGVGNSILHFRRHLPQLQLTCADVSRRSLDLAEARFGGMADSLLIENECIPANNDSFDVAFSACVFHHISHEEHVHWLRELRRVTRPGGMLVIFEHNPLNPLTVHAVNTCPFDEHARLIRAGKLATSYRQAGWGGLRVQYHQFFPRMLSALRCFDRHLSSVPLGAQYSIAGTKTN